ncbi:MAG: hypothetical protein AAGF07_05165 [Patescibacteria group bacterium]
MINFSIPTRLTRTLTIIFSCVALLTTAQSCSIPGFTPTAPANPTILGILKQGDSRSTSQNFIKINAVRQLDGNVNVDGLSNLSGLKTIRYDQDILYLLTQEKGLFRSETGGYTWDRKYIFPVGSTKTDQNEINRELNSQITRNNLVIPTDLAINPQNDQIIYVAATDNKVGKVFQSTDGGETFRESYTEVKTNTGVRFITVDPRNPLRVYAVLLGGSLIRSLDGGFTWQKIRSFKETPVQIGFVPEFNNILFLLFPSQGLAVSSNDGEDFRTVELTKEQSSIGENQPKDGLDLSFSGNSTFGRYDKIVPITANTSESWILLADKQIWYTDNLDTKMTKLVLPLQSEQQNLLDVAPDPKLGLEKILVSINDKLFESTNKGISWSVNNRITTKIGNIGQILIDPDDTKVIYLMLLDARYTRNGGLFT